MKSRSLISLVVLGSLLSFSATRASAQEYALDATHTAVTFQIAHMGVSWTHGRFNNISGGFVIAPNNPANTSFALTIRADSIDTGNPKRDEHLRSPDFFNVKQFPAIDFSSTRVVPAKDGYDVTGNLTLHGQTRPVTFRLQGGKKAEFPPGVHRTGFSMSLKIKRSEFGMSGMQQAVGDDVFIVSSFEGVQK